MPAGSSVPSRNAPGSVENVHGGPLAVAPGGGAEAFLAPPVAPPVAAAAPALAPAAGPAQAPRAASVPSSSSSRPQKSGLRHAPHFGRYPLAQALKERNYVLDDQCLNAGCPAAPVAADTPLVKWEAQSADDQSRWRIDVYPVNVVFHFKIDPAPEGWPRRLSAAAEQEKVCDMVHVLAECGRVDDLEEVRDSEVPSINPMSLGFRSVLRERFGKEFKVKVVVVKDRFVDTRFHAWADGSPADAFEFVICPEKTYPDNKGWTKLGSVTHALVRAPIPKEPPRPPKAAAARGRPAARRALVPVATPVSPAGSPAAAPNAPRLPSASRSPAPRTASQPPPSSRPALQSHLSRPPSAPPPGSTPDQPEPLPATAPPPRPGSRDPSPAPSLGAAGGQPLEGRADSQAGPSSGSDSDSACSHPSDAPQSASHGASLHPPRDSLAASHASLEPPPARLCAAPVEVVQGFPVSRGRVIGQGGFARVYEAHSEEAPGVPLAAKVFLHKTALDDACLEIATARNLTAGLEDPWAHGLLQPLGADAADGRVALYLPYVKSERETEVVRQIRGRPGVLRELVRDVAAALCQAHKLGVIHHDLKMKNVLTRVTECNESGWIRTQSFLIDFSLAECRVPKDPSQPAARAVYARRKPAWELRSDKAPALSGAEANEVRLAECDYIRSESSGSGTPGCRAPEVVFRDRSHGPPTNEYNHRFEKQKGQSHFATANSDVYCLGLMLVKTLLQLLDEPVDDFQLCAGGPSMDDLAAALAFCCLYGFDKVHQHFGSASVVKLFTKDVDRDELLAALKLQGEYMKEVLNLDKGCLDCRWAAREGPSLCARHAVLPPEFYELLTGLLALEPTERPTAAGVRRDPFVCGDGQPPLAQDWETKVEGKKPSGRGRGRQAEVERLRAQPPGVAVLACLSGADQEELRKKLPVQGYKEVISAEDWKKRLDAEEGGKHLGKGRKLSRVTRTVFTGSYYEDGKTTSADLLSWAKRNCVPVQCTPGVQPVAVLACTWNRQEASPLATELKAAGYDVMYAAQWKKWCRATPQRIALVACGSYYGALKASFGEGKRHAQWNASKAPLLSSGNPLAAGDDLTTCIELLKWADEQQIPVKIIRAGAPEMGKLRLKAPEAPAGASECYLARESAGAPGIKPAVLHFDRGSLGRFLENAKRYKEARAERERLLQAGEPASAWPSLPPFPALRFASPPAAPPADRRCDLCKRDVPGTKDRNDDSAELLHMKLEAHIAALEKRGGEIAERVYRTQYGREALWDAPRGAEAGLSESEFCRQRAEEARRELQRRAGACRSALPAPPLKHDDENPSPDKRHPEAGPGEGAGAAKVGEGAAGDGDGPRGAGGPGLAAAVGPQAGPEPHEEAAGGSEQAADHVLAGPSGAAAAEEPQTGPSGTAAAAEAEAAAESLEEAAGGSEQAADHVLAAPSGAAAAEGAAMEEASPKEAESAAVQEAAAGEDGEAGTEKNAEAQGAASDAVAAGEEERSPKPQDGAEEAEATTETKAGPKKRARGPQAAPPKAAGAAFSRRRQRRDAGGDEPGAASSSLASVGLGPALNPYKNPSREIDEVYAAKGGAKASQSSSSQRSSVEHEAGAGAQDEGQRGRGRAGPKAAPPASTFLRPVAHMTRRGCRELADRPDRVLLAGRPVLHAPEWPLTSSRKKKPSAEAQQASQADEASARKRRRGGAESASKVKKAEASDTDSPAPKAEPPAPEPPAPDPPRAEEPTPQRRGRSAQKEKDKEASAEAAQQPQAAGAKAPGGCRSSRRRSSAGDDGPSGCAAPAPSPKAAEKAEAGDEPPAPRGGRRSGRKGSNTKDEAAAPPEPAAAPEATPSCLSPSAEAPEESAKGGKGKGKAKGKGKGGSARKSEAGEAPAAPAPEGPASPEPAAARPEPPPEPAAAPEAAGNGKGKGKGKAKGRSARKASAESEEAPSQPAPEPATAGPSASAEPAAAPEEAASKGKAKAKRKGNKGACVYRAASEAEEDPAGKPGQEAAAGGKGKASAAPTPAADGRRRSARKGGAAEPIEPQPQREDDAAPKRAKRRPQKAEGPERKPPKRKGGASAPKEDAEEAVEAFAAASSKEEEEEAAEDGSDSGEEPEGGEEDAAAAASGDEAEGTGDETGAAAAAEGSGILSSIRKRVLSLVSSHFGLARSAPEETTPARGQEEGDGVLGASPPAPGPDPEDESAPAEERRAGKRPQKRKGSSSASKAGPAETSVSGLPVGDWDVVLEGVHAFFDARKARGVRRPMDVTTEDLQEVKDDPRFRAALEPYPAVWLARKMQALPNDLRMYIKLEELVKNKALLNEYSGREEDDEATPARGREEREEDEIEASPPAPGPDPEGDEAWQVAAMRIAGVDLYAFTGRERDGGPGFHTRSASKAPPPPEEEEEEEATPPPRGGRERGRGQKRPLSPPPSSPLELSPGEESEPPPARPRRAASARGRRG